MSNLDGNKPTLFDQMLNRVSSIKLSGGIFGRVCYVLIAVVFGIVCLVLKSDLWWMPPLALFAIIVVVCPFLWKVITFAEANPHAAIFEGAQYLKYEQLTHSSKNHPTIDIASEISEEEHPVPAIPYSEIEKPDVADNQGLLTNSDDTEVKK